MVINLNVQSNVLHSLGILFYFLFIYFVKKIPVRMTAPRFELTFQRQKVSRLLTELPGDRLVITHSKIKNQPGKVANQSCSWSAVQEKLIYPCPRSRLRIWSSETGSAVLSRVSLLVSILRLNLGFTYGIPPEFRGGVHLFT